jgi:hypothetical protein
LWNGLHIVCHVCVCVRVCVGQEIDLCPRDVRDDRGSTIFLFESLPLCSQPIDRERESCRHRTAAA